MNFLLAVSLQNRFQSAHTAVVVSPVQSYKYDDYTCRNRKLFVTLPKNNKHMKTRFLRTGYLLLSLLLFSGQTLLAQNTRMVQTSNEIVRINPQKANQIDYSTNGGRTWITRYSGTSSGEFIDMVIYNGELIAITSKGVYYSTNSGRTWINRYSGTSCGKFLSLMDNGNELLAQTEKGLYYSTNCGRTWMRR